MFLKRLYWYLAAFFISNIQHVKTILRQQKIKCPIAVTPDLFLVTCVTNQPLGVNSRKEISGKKKGKTNEGRD